MKILGIDPALTVTGWGVINSADRSAIKHIDHGIIKTNPSETLSERLKHIYVSITKVMEMYHPDEISIENTFVNMNGGSSLLLATARGMHLLAAAMFEREIFEYAPNLIKKSITGNGHAEKSQVRTSLRYHIVNCPNKLRDDESDALATALTHSNVRNLERMLPK